MRTYYDKDRTYSLQRLHPYAPSAPDQSGFVDFKREPEKISEVLEDFRPYAEQNGIQAFYALLRYLNGPNSFLETCDCALRPPATHSDSNSKLALSTHGRLFLMYRDEALNCSRDHAEWLCGKLMSVLNGVDPDLTANEAVVGFTLNPALHTSISKGEWTPDGKFECDEDDSAYGLHTMLSFWAYGNDARHAFQNLERLFNNLLEACIEVDRQILVAAATAQDSSGELG